MRVFPLLCSFILSAPVSVSLKCAYILFVFVTVIHMLCTSYNVTKTLYAGEKDRLYRNISIFWLELKAVIILTSNVNLFCKLFHDLQ